ncbi:hypothetical protein GOBAR_AA20411 [Gossypium barbadense]|uniref:Reverse transcriptase domain-containing protein n=1 Tax=Gossypium barbadense TaxID=3634 RepID=A0A2P5XA82_GOSBA|nr:hypothetical protein GOBAR_AA20411 [Gossypium barbadense]
MPELVVSEGKNEVGQNEQKSVSTEYKPCVPYPNATRKDHSDEQLGKFLKLLKKLYINLPFIEALSNMPNAVKFLKELLANKRKLDERSHVELNAVCSAILQNKLPNKLKDPGSFTIPCLIGSLDEISSKDTHEPCLTHNKGYTHEVRMLQIEELDEWITFKPRKHDEPKLRQNELNASPNQLKVGDKVSLDASDPQIDTSKPNEEISLTVLSIFPFGTVEVSHPKFDTFKVNNTHLRPYFDEIHSRDEEYKLLEPP